MNTKATIAEIAAAAAASLVAQFNELSDEERDDLPDYCSAGAGEFPFGICVEKDDDSSFVSMTCDLGNFGGDIWGVASYSDVSAVADAIETLIYLELEQGE